MKRYGLITIHNAINHGAVLQTLATQKAFSKCDCCVDVINYMPNYIQEDNLPIRRNCGPVIRILDCISKFTKFISKNLRLTEKVYNSEEIAEKTKDYDGLISGSDQIWNPSITGGHIDKSYLCDFAQKGQNVISYASSLGDKLGFDRSVEKLFQTEMKRYSSISVREKSGINWLKDRINIAAKQVVDPTLLLTKEEWSFATEQSLLNIKNPYIFVYSVGRTKELIQYAKRMQKVLGIDIIVSNSIVLSNCNK